ncbi:MAG: hypothetical protein HY390_00410 [Deltaproteobacteria bacterium]|nr:hypothetical protein [Deltaproteobacteria bacterium]
MLRKYIPFVLSAFFFCFLPLLALAQEEAEKTYVLVGYRAEFHNEYSMHAPQQELAKAEEEFRKNFNSAVLEVSSTMNAWLSKVESTFSELNPMTDELEIMTAMEFLDEFRTQFSIIPILFKVKAEDVEKIKQDLLETVLTIGEFKVERVSQATYAFKVTCGVWSNELDDLDPWLSTTIEKQKFFSSPVLAQEDELKTLCKVVQQSIETLPVELQERALVQYHLFYYMVGDPSWIDDGFLPQMARPTYVRVEGQLKAKVPLPMIEEACDAKACLMIPKNETPPPSPKKVEADENHF